MVNQSKRSDISIVHSGCSSGVRVFFFSFFLFISVHSYSIPQRKRDEIRTVSCKIVSVCVCVCVSQYVCMLVVYVEIHTGGCVMIFLSFFFVI